jgi:hypothetical protein
MFMRSCLRVIKSPLRLRSHFLVSLRKRRVMISAAEQSRNTWIKGKRLHHIQAVVDGVDIGVGRQFRQSGISGNILETGLGTRPSGLTGHAAQNGSSRTVQNPNG